ncbi:MAG: tripartite tricarboxylate transporter permease [Planctomycetota bacterium]
MFDAIVYLIQPYPLFLLVLGTLLGIIIGAIPGLTGAMLISLTVPLTFGMNGVDALVLLVAMYVGSVSGGLLSATLLRMPGTPASIMTTLDGYPLAKSGQPGRALGLGVAASAVGGILSWLFLWMLARPMANLATQLSPFDVFSMVLVALVLIVSISNQSLLAGLLSGSLGMLSAMPGTSPTGQLRLTAGFAELNDGLKVLPVLIGLYAINQIVREIIAPAQQMQTVEMSRRGLFVSFNDLHRHGLNMFRSSLIGSWIGLLPGIGANIGSVVAYTVAKNRSRAKDAFGNGSEEGIVASEAANNATVGGALIPLIALGIPGSVVDAILLGALMIHNVQPGPLLFKSNPLEVNCMIATVLAANVVMVIIMLVLAGQLARLMQVPRALLLPIILACCVVGSFALGNRGFDVAVMLVFGLVGFLFQAWQIPLAPFVIGFVLAPIAERKLCEGLMLSGGSYLPLVIEPVSVIFLLVASIVLVFAIRNRLRPSSIIDEPATS